MHTFRPCACKCIHGSLRIFFLVVTAYFLSLSLKWGGSQFFKNVCILSCSMSWSHAKLKPNSNLSWQAFWFNLHPLTRLVVTSNNLKLNFSSLFLDLLSFLPFATLLSKNDLTFTIKKYNTVYLELDILNRKIYTSMILKHAVEIFLPNTFATL